MTAKNAADDGFDMRRVAPDQLVTNFSHSRLYLGLFLALVIHAVVIGGTSVQYVMDTWIDPEAAIAREEARKDEEKQKQLADKKAREADAKADAEAKAKAEGKKGPEKGGSDKPGPGKAGSSNDYDPDDLLGEKAARRAPKDEGNIPKWVEETPVGKRVTEKASPDEIPTDPEMDPLMDETNPDE